MGTVVLKTVETVAQGTPEYTWSNKPSPREFGIGQAWFSDIGAMGYSDGLDWSAPSILKNNNVGLNCTVWRYPLSSTAPLDNSYWVYVPINLTGDFAYYGTGKWLTAPNMNRFGVGRIGTQIWNTAGAGVTKVGTWAASSPSGSYAANTQSSTAADTITYVTAGHTLVHRYAAVNNGGYAIVAIDDDFTAANRLPLFTADDYTNGLCRSTDVGKRYINCYAPGVFPDYHLLLADDLVDTAHTVKFEATGTKPTASSGARLYSGGIIGCSSTDAGQAVNGTRVVAHIIPINDPYATGGSAMLLTPEVEKAVATGTYEFLGDVHGAETGESFYLYVDGVNQSALAAGAYLSGACISIETSATIASTDATGTPVARKRINYTYNATYSEHPLIVSFKIDWLVAKKCRSAYPMMLPMGMGKVGTSLTINTWWDKCQFGEYVAPTAAFSTNGNAQNGNVKALKAIISSSLHDFIATAEFLDNGESMNYFQKSPPYNVFLHDRSDGYDKVYFARSTAFNLESFAVGDSYKGVVAFSIK